jgi:hypothetical protein
MVAKSYYHSLAYELTHWAAQEPIGIYRSAIHLELMVGSLKFCDRPL